MMTAEIGEINFLPALEAIDLTVHAKRVLQDGSAGRLEELDDAIDLALTPARALIGELCRITVTAIALYSNAIDEPLDVACAHVLGECESIRRTANDLAREIQQ